MIYKLPHPLDRPGQPEAMDWILNSNKKYLILCAPTGFGKSPLAACASIGYRTLALVLHKSLQSTNYRDQYDFDILYGKSNYPCLERNKKGSQSTFLPQIKWTAFDCSNPHCACPYQQQELNCLSSQRVSLNYAKYLMSKGFTKRFQPEIMFCDEAHNLPHIVMDYVGLTLRWDNEFINFKCRPDPERLQYSEAINYLRQMYKAIAANKPNREKDLARWRKWKRLHRKILTTGELIGKKEPEDWYFEVDKEKLLIRPLTAKYHFKDMFGKADKVVLMSATITPAIAERLGLDEDEFDYHYVPSPWPVPSRLIYDLGGPAINYKSSEADKQENARLISSVLRSDCSGIIHVSSKNQAYEIADRLSRFNDDYYEFHYPMTGTSTDEQLEEWQVQQQPGAYYISWNCHEGVDLGNDAINIIAKVPYASIGNNYERACLEYDKGWYLEKTAYKLQQACGRNRRGIDEHYLPGARQVFIADSAWHKLKTLLSDDFIRSVRNWR